MRRPARTFVLGTVPFLAALLLWQIASMLKWFPQWIYPSPVETARALWHLVIDGTLAQLIGISIGNVVPAFLLGYLAAVIIGTIIGVHPTTRTMFFPMVSALYPVPSMAWLPLLLLVFGFTRLTILAVIFVSTLIRTVYIVIGGVRAVDQKLILVAMNLGFKRSEIVKKVILPGALPHLMTGARMGFGNAWRSLIAAEMLVATVGGLGKFIWYSQWYFNYANVFSGILTIATIGVIAEQLLFKPIERRTLMRWGVIREPSVETTGGW